MKQNLLKEANEREGNSPLLDFDFFEGNYELIFLDLNDVSNSILYCETYPRVLITKGKRKISMKTLEQALVRLQCRVNDYKRQKRGIYA